MIAEIPFIYRQTFVPRYGRRQADVGILDMTPVDIPEADTSEVTVLLERGRTAWVECRGALFTDRPAPRRLSDFSPDNPFVVSSCYLYFDHKPLGIGDVRGVREVVSDDRPSAVAAANARAATLLLLPDGRVLVPSRGPLLVLEERLEDTSVRVRDLVEATPGVLFPRSGDGEVPACAMTPADYARARPALREAMGSDWADPDFADHPLYARTVRAESLAAAAHGVFDIDETAAPWHLPLRHLDAFLRFSDPAFDPGADLSGLVALLDEVAACAGRERYVPLGLDRKVKAAVETLLLHRDPPAPEPGEDGPAFRIPGAS